VPVPDVRAERTEPISAYRVYVTLPASPSRQARIAATPCGAIPDSAVRSGLCARRHRLESHIAADADAARIGQLQSAAVVYARLRQDDPDLESESSYNRVMTLRHAYPGCRSPCSPTDIAA